MRQITRCGLIGLDAKESDLVAQAAGEYVVLTPQAERYASQPYDRKRGGTRERWHVQIVGNGSMLPQPTRPMNPVDGILLRPCRVGRLCKSST